MPDPSTTPPTAPAHPPAPGAPRDSAATGAPSRDALMAAALRSIGDAVITTDASGRVTFLNPVAEALTGWPLAEAAGRPVGEVFRIVDEAARRPVPNPVDRVLAEGQVVGLGNHTLLLARDGLERPVDDSGAPIVDDTGAVAGVVLVFRDASGQRQAEALAEARRTVLEAVHSTVSIDEVMQRAVDAAARALGCETAAVSLHRGGAWTVHCVYGFAPSVVGSRMDDREEPHALLAIRTKQPVVVNDAFNDERVNREHMRQWGVRAVLVVPLVIDGAAAGVLFLNHHCPGRVFGEREAEFAAWLASTLALALANAGLVADLAAGQAKANALIEHAPTGIYEIAFDGSRFLSVNDVVCRWTGYTREELLAMDPLSLTDEEGRQRFRSRLGRKLAGDETVEPLELKVIGKDGRELDVVLTARVFQQQDGRPTSVQVIAHDLTEQKENEAELRRLNRTLRALSLSNRAMVAAQSEPEYLHTVCRIIVEECEHAMVWIGLAEDDESRTVRPTASAGFEQGYLETLDISWADTERGRGPTGAAIRSGKPCGCADMVHDPCFAPWREEALKRGYGSSLAVPMMAGGAALGAITIYSRKPGAFPEAEVDLLTELADDVAHGIMTMRTRDARARAEQAVRQSEERYHTLFNTLIEGFCIVELLFDEHDHPIDYRFLEVNPAFEAQTGLRDAQGRLMRDLAPDHEAHWFETFGRIALTGEPARFENEARALGRSYEVFAYRVGGPESRKVAILFNDISERRRAEEERARATAAAERERLILQTVIQQMPAGIILTDADGTNARNNEEMDRIWRRPMEPAETVDRHDYVGYHPDGRPYTPDEWPLTRALRNGEVTTGEEMTILRGDGTSGTVLASASPIRDADGNVIAGVVIDTDISELKEAERTLQAYHDRLQFHMRNTPLAMVEWDSNLTITGWSGQAERIFGWTAEETVGRPLASLPIVYTPDAPIVEGVLRDMLGGTRPSNVTSNRNLTKDGRVIHCEWYNSSLCDEQGRMVSALSLVLDVTEREALEAALKERAAEIETLMDVAPVAIWVSGDPECRVLKGNAYADERIMRVPRGGNISRSAPVGAAAVSYQVFRDGIELQPNQLPAQVAAATGQPVEDTEVEVLFEDGRVVDLVLAAAPLFDAEGRVRGSVLTGLDVSYLRHAQQEMERRGLEIEGLNARLQRAMAETHHRVKNNLQTIAALIDMLRMGGEHTVPTSELERLGRHVRGLATIHDLLTQEARGSGGVEFIDAAEALGKLKPLLDDMVGGRELHFHVSNLRLPVRQATGLAVLVNELVSNAVKHGKGAIDLSLGLAATDACLEVRDCGAGFPAGFDAAAAANTGLELVLSVGRWDLQGEVEFGNADGGGARVAVRFPAHGT